MLYLDAPATPSTATILNDEPSGSNGGGGGGDSSGGDAGDDDKSPSSSPSAVSAASSTSPSSLSTDAAGGNELAAALNRQILRLYGTFLSDDGASVDYDGLAASELFAEYERAAAALRRLDAALLDDAARTAFFVNVYNMLEIHSSVAAASLERGSVEWRRSKNRAAYRIGDDVLTLGDIEHGILRANARPPYALSRLFGAGDRRARLALPAVDPRVHFILNCGARSCPPIRIVQPDNVDGALDAAAAAFINDDGNVGVDVATHTLRLSSIFKWYNGDFGGSLFSNAAVVRYIAERHREHGDTIKAWIKDSSWKVTHVKYDWSHNAST